MQSLAFFIIIETHGDDIELADVLSAGLVFLGLVDQPSVT
jgi:hypothetical protein